METVWVCFEPGYLSYSGEGGKALTLTRDGSGKGAFCVRDHVLGTWGVDRGLLGILLRCLKRCAFDYTTEGETTVTGIPARVVRDWEVNL